jgi:hypothetical protein
VKEEVEEEDEKEEDGGHKKDKTWACLRHVFFGIVTSTAVVDIL